MGQEAEKVSAQFVTRSIERVFHWRSKTSDKKNGGKREVLSYYIVPLVILH
jgi:hypothetical protein